jgi:hypothetical protein
MQNPDKFAGVLKSFTNENQIIIFLPVGDIVTIS